MSTRTGREPELDQACSPSHFSSARNGSPGLGGLGWGPLPFPGEGWGTPTVCLPGRYLQQVPGPRRRRDLRLLEEASPCPYPKETPKR